MISCYNTAVFHAETKNHTVDGVTHLHDNAERIVNKMARDYEFDQDKKTATSIAVSSFAVIHQVSTPLCYSKSKRYDDTWAK